MPIKANEAKKTAKVFFKRFNRSSQHIMIKDNTEVIISNRITIKKGYGDLRYLELLFNGAEAHIYMHGAHILHYQPAGQQPVLWQSEESWFETGKPIRGGISVCWPWFGSHPNDPAQPAHGFVRHTEWELVSTSATIEATIVTLQFPEASCPKGISLILTVELSSKLSVYLETINNSEEDFKFSEALHSYFSIQDIQSVKVYGLEGQHYINSLSAVPSPQLQNGSITFSAETDRIYINTPHTCTLVDEVFKRSICIQKENSLSTVVWNPWIDKSIRMPDFGELEYQNMVCVETTNCGINAVLLGSGETHKIQLHISARLI